MKHFKQTKPIFQRKSEYLTRNLGLKYIQHHHKTTNRPYFCHPCSVMKLRFKQLAAAAGAEAKQMTAEHRLARTTTATPGFYINLEAKCLRIGRNVSNI